MLHAKSSTVLYYLPMARTDPQVNLRIPAELKEQIDAAAEQNKRSMNAEVVARLQRSLDEKATESLGPLLVRLERSLGAAEVELARAEIAAGIVAELLLNANLELPDSAKYKWKTGTGSPLEKMVERLRAGFAPAFSRAGVPSGELWELQQVLDELKRESGSLRNPDLKVSAIKPEVDLGPEYEPEFLTVIARSLIAK